MRLFRRAVFLALLSTISIRPGAAAPGDHFSLSPSELPAPNTTVPTTLEPSFDLPPPNFLPQVPAGFAISLFASDVKFFRSFGRV
jgi:hypothetical protein